MNLFLLSLNITLLAAMHCDKHIVKMPLETTQMLYCAFWILEGEPKKAPNGGYKKTHVNHPITLWVRECKANYIFTCKVGLELCKEYTRRFNKIHATEKHLKWLSKNIPKLFLNNIIDEITLFPQAMPEEYKFRNPTKNQDVVKAYIRYYIFEKMSFAKWNHSTDYSNFFSKSSLKKKDLKRIAKRKGFKIKNESKQDIIKILEL